MSEWKEVRLKTSIGECFDVFPYDDPPEHLDVAGDNATVFARARDRFLAFPPEFPCCLYKSHVLIHNPESTGGLEARIRHVTHREIADSKHELDIDKCRWLPAVLPTIQHAAAVIEDWHSKKILFVRRYRGFGFHFVVAKTVLQNFGGFKAGMVGALLITQFWHGYGIQRRQSHFPILWKRP